MDTPLSRLDILHRLASHLNRSLDLEEMLGSALPLILELTGLSTGWVFLRTEAGTFTLAAAAGLPPGLEADGRMWLRKGECQCQDLLNRGELAEALNLLECERLQRAWEALPVEDAERRLGDLRHHASVPLISGGRPLGILNLAWPGERALDAETLELLSLIGQTLAVAVDRAYLYERERRQQQARYRDLFEGVPVGLFRSTPEGRILEVNQAFVQMLGYPNREALLQVRAQELYVDPEERRRWQARLEREGVVQGFETQLRRWDGGILWVRESARRLTLPDGTVVYEGTLEDISGYKAAERTIQDQQDQLRIQARTLRILSRILALLNAMTDLEAAFPPIARHLRELTACDRVSLALLNPEGWGYTLVAADPYDPSIPSGTPFPLDASSAVPDIQAGRIHLTPNLEEEASFPAEAALYRAGYRSRVNLPLHVEGRPIGALNLAWRQPHGFREDHLDALRQIADALALAVERNRWLIETRRRAAQQEALNAIITEAAGALDLQALLQVALEHTLRALNLGQGLIWARRMGYAHGLPEEALQVLEQAWREGMRFTEAVVVEDWTRIDPSFPFASLAPTVLKFGVRATLAAPILVEGRCIGGLALTFPEPRTWSEEEVSFLTAVGRQLGGAADRLHLLGRIHEQAQLLQRILDTAPGGILFLDAEHRLQLANPSARAFLELLNPVRPGERLEHLGGRPIEAFLTPPPPGGCHEVTTEGPRPHIFEVLSQPWEDGEVLRGWVLVLLDVTLEREVRRRIQQQDRLAAVGQLASGIAHDFNNLLMGVIGFAQLLQMEPGLSPEARENLEMIAQQGQRAAQLARQLLDFSRRSDLSPQPLELIPFLKEQVRFLVRTLPETIRVSFDHKPGERYVVHADPTQLQQILTNLALNARDAMPEGGELRIRLSSYRRPAEAPPPLPGMEEGPWVLLEVEDTGTGIPEEVLPHIFEPFFTTKPAGEGTGLGLAQVYGLVKQHGGYIDVESRVGEGTCFRIYLPLLEAGAPARSEEPEPVPRGKGEVILVVEDEASVRTTLVRMLQELGYRPLAAPQGPMGLALFQTHREEIALVIADVVMPEMGGVELLHTLRSLGARVPVLLISGYPASVDPDWLRQVNARLLPKPFGIEQLARQVDAALHGRPDIPPNDV